MNKKVSEILYGKGFSRIRTSDVYGGIKKFIFLWIMVKHEKLKEDEMYGIAICEYRYSGIYEGR